MARFLHPYRPDSYWLVCVVKRFSWTKVFKNRHFFSSEKKNNFISIYNLYNKKRVFPFFMPKSLLTMVGGNDLVSFSMFKNSEKKNKLISNSKILKSCLKKKTLYEKILGKEAMSLYSKKRIFSLPRSHKPSLTRRQ